MTTYRHPFQTVHPSTAFETPSSPTPLKFKQSQSRKKRKVQNDGDRKADASDTGDEEENCEEEED